MAKRRNNKPRKRFVYMARSLWRKDGRCWLSMWTNDPWPFYHSRVLIKSLDEVKTRINEFADSIRQYESSKSRT